ncbi:uncharacterized protein [Chelonus insularis]|uniref:uncharacterized protein n=1 Tax=Chelonus insularis TaxID=460826 RepID=UPI00158924D1|nr:uncharacterized protein LOC118073547 [Chelonus insularis]
MLRQLIILGTLVLAVGLDVCFGEPINRQHRSFVINDNAVTIDCAGSRADSPECHSVSLKQNKTASATVKKYGDVEEEEKSWSIADWFEDRAVDEARGKKGGKKGKGYVILLAGAMKAMLLYAMIHAVALLAGKALVVAKVALAIAGTLALKKALEHSDKTSFEIVKHPQHSFVQTHSSSVDYDHGGGYEGHRRKRFTR